MPCPLSSYASLMLCPLSSYGFALHNQPYHPTLFPLRPCTMSGPERARRGLTPLVPGSRASLHHNLAPGLWLCCLYPCHGRLFHQTHLHATVRNGLPSTVVNCCQRCAAGSEPQGAAAAARRPPCTPLSPYPISATDLRDLWYCARYWQLSAICLRRLRYLRCV
eukprot:2203273-Rhodomonas_salina.1